MDAKLCYQLPVSHGGGRDCCIYVNESYMVNIGSLCCRMKCALPFREVPKADMTEDVDMDDGMKLCACYIRHEYTLCIIYY